LILAALALVWEGLARWQDNDLLLPTFTQTARAFALGHCLRRAAATRARFARGLAARLSAGHCRAFLLTTLAVSTRAGRDLLATLTAMFNPLPAIALLPLALLWFGLGRGSPDFRDRAFGDVAAVAHTFGGFQAVARDAAHGRPQLRARRHALRAADPGAGGAAGHPFGLEDAWAFAWRTLIAAELVFGISSGARAAWAGTIFQNRNELFTDKVFAGLVMVILIGLAVESFVFQTLERVTVRRWGVQR